MPPKMPSNTAAPQKRKASHPFPGNSTKRQKQTPWEARVITTQRSSTLPKDAATDSINLATFLAAREFEIKALEDGMKRSKEVLSTRAFQQVPRELRRRTASHNVKRVPGRLQQRATREMKEDNTPTVKQGSRKGGTRSRIRAETAKRLGLLGDKKRKGLNKKKEGTVADGVSGRIPTPKARKGALNLPPKSKSKFRKRQMHKTWLPTHLWHAKRSTMTPPKEPLWRFALPLSPTEKSYRPTHRAGGARGAVCWDMSYMSTIGLEGTDLALEKVLRCIGVSDDSAWGKAGQKWRDGKRSWNGWTSRDVKSQRRVISPITIIWQAPLDHPTMQPEDEVMADDSTKGKKKPAKRQILLRVHPAAFLELWTEILRVSKQQRPIVHIEDLRFEVGSIEITGPGATETLLGILQPFHADDKYAELFRALAGVTNASSLPLNALLGFSIMDPRLRYPPRKFPLPDISNEENAFAVLEKLSTWPVDESKIPLAFFDRQARYRATRLPSQKALNRRKGLSAPGDYPSLTPLDPEIPIIILTNRGANPASTQGTYTLLAPWKCILPIWYGIVHYPLSTGGNPRHGGLLEQQQLAFEHELPWFPADYPGTNAGWEWEKELRTKRKKEWDARPKGKRTAYESVHMGCGRKGEVGTPWNCDLEMLLDHKTPNDTPPAKANKKGGAPTTSDEAETDADEDVSFQQMSKSVFNGILSSKTFDIPEAAVATIRITFVTKGVPQPCARIYRLPDAPNPTTSSQPPAEEDAQTTPTAHSLPSDLREQWLSLLPAPVPKSTKASKYTPHGLKPAPVARPATLEQRKRLLAQDLLSQPALTYPRAAAAAAEPAHPVVPDADHLIGFVTTGSFNLAEGRATAVGTVLVARAAPQPGAALQQRKLCIVRNVGETVGRLGVWEPV